MRLISLMIGKAILRILRFTGRGGSALPGLIIEKMNPNFLSGMLKQLPMGVVIVTGTNGKTTTTKTITSLLEGQGVQVLTNKSGSNFVRGIVSVVLNNATLSGKLNYDIAVFEQDEAHAVHFIHRVKPKGVVVLNIMRDQMDRFGEIDTTSRLLQEVVNSCTDWVVLNGNDERVSSLRSAEGARTYYFGHSKELQHSFLTDDELHHGADQSYHKAGGLVYELTNFSLSKVEVNYKGSDISLPTALSGSHNAINLVAALTTLRAILSEIDQETLMNVIKNLVPAFGRGESFSLSDGTEVMLQLVKNPGGFTHSLRMLELKPYEVVAMAVNDEYADGRDVSWLWDVDFNRLENSKSTIITGGTRGYDIAVRLKYDGVITKNISLSISDFLKEINNLASKKSVIIFCTYTAMLKIRALYQKQNSQVYKVEV